MDLSKTVPSLIPFQAIESETCMFSLCHSRFHLVCLGRENRSVWVSSVGDLQPVQAVFLEQWLLGLTSAFQLRRILAVLMGKIARSPDTDGCLHCCTFRFIALWSVISRTSWPRWNWLEKMSVQKQLQPCTVSAFLPHQTGRLHHNPGESALVTPKTWAMTHLWSPQVLSKSIDFFII